MKHVPPPAGASPVDVPAPPAEQHADAIKALARLRREAAAEVERLLTFLDELDGDADLESTELDDDEEGFDAEPSLGSSNDHHGSGALYANVEPNLRGLDLEDQHDGAEPDVDGEPLLGSFDAMVNQDKAWRQHRLATSDGELDDCDREDDDPAELGEVSGIGDHDGLNEQLSMCIFPSGLAVKGVL
jgi:hypothetical protein